MLQSKTLQINTKGDLCYITFPRLSACNAVNHAFSTRLGGVSTGHLGQMNLGITNGDSEAAVKENYRRICSAAGIDPQKTVVARQTHTVNLRVVTEADLGKGVYLPRDYDNVDGLITNIKGAALVTLYADCVPLLFCDPVKKVVACSHSGWRGTAHKMGAVTVKKMTEQYGCDPKDIIAAVGPSIGKCCYEVDMPVYEEFAANGHNTEAIFTPKDSEHFMLDLQNANRLVLLESGILPENMDISDLCTCCNSESLHSHRATNGKRGIMGAIIALK